MTFAWFPWRLWRFSLWKCSSVSEFLFWMENEVIPTKKTPSGAAIGNHLVNTDRLGLKLELNSILASTDPLPTFSPFPWVFLVPVCTATTVLFFTLESSTSQSCAILTDFLNFSMSPAAELVILCPVGRHKLVFGPLRVFWPQWESCVYQWRDWGNSQLKSVWCVGANKLFPTAVESTNFKLFLPSDIQKWVSLSHAIATLSADPQFERRIALGTEGMWSSRGNNTIPPHFTSWISADSIWVIPGYSRRFLCPWGIRVCLWLPGLGAQNLYVFRPNSSGFSGEKLFGGNKLFPLPSPYEVGP